MKAELSSSPETPSQRDAWILLIAFSTSLRRALLLLPLCTVRPLDRMIRKNDADRIPGRAAADRDVGRVYLVDVYGGNETWFWGVSFHLTVPSRNMGGVDRRRSKVARYPKTLRAAASRRNGCQSASNFDPRSASN